MKDLIDNITLSGAGEPHCCAKSFEDLWECGQSYSVMKKLFVAVLLKETEYKIWILPMDNQEKERINCEEARNGYSLATWQSWLFPPNMGDLIVEQRAIGNTTSKLEKIVTISEEEVFELEESRQYCFMPGPGYNKEILFSVKSVSQESGKLQISARFAVLPLPAYISWMYTPISPSPISHKEDGDFSNRRACSSCGRKNVYSELRVSGVVSSLSLIFIFWLCFYAIYHIP